MSPFQESKHANWAALQPQARNSTFSSFATDNPKRPTKWTAAVHKCCFFGFRFPLGLSCQKNIFTRFHMRHLPWSHRLRCSIKWSIRPNKEHSAHEDRPPAADMFNSWDVQFYRPKSAHSHIRMATSVAAHWWRYKSVLILQTSMWKGL